MKTRYQATYRLQPGIREMMRPPKALYMFDTRREAERYLELVLARNSEERLVELCGEDALGTFRVDAISCHDNGDPIDIYVRD